MDQITRAPTHPTARSRTYVSNGLKSPFWHSVETGLKGTNPSSQHSVETGAFASHDLEWRQLTLHSLFSDGSNGRIPDHEVIPGSPASGEGVCNPLLLPVSSSAGKASGGTGQLVLLLTPSATQLVLLQHAGYLSARRRWGSLPLHPIWGSPPESFKVVIRCSLRNATRNLKFLLSWQKFGAQGQLSKQHSSSSSFLIPQRKKMLLYFSLSSTKWF